MKSKKQSTAVDGMEFWREFLVEFWWEYLEEFWEEFWGALVSNYR